MFGAARIVAQETDIGRVTAPTSGTSMRTSCHANNLATCSSQYTSVEVQLLDQSPSNKQGVPVPSNFTHTQQKQRQRNVREFWIQWAWSQDGALRTRFALSVLWQIWNKHRLTFACQGWTLVRSGLPRAPSKIHWSELLTHVYKRTQLTYWAQLIHSRVMGPDQ